MYMQDTRPPAAVSGRVQLRALQAGAGGGGGGACTFAMHDLEPPPSKCQAVLWTSCVHVRRKEACALGNGLQSPKKQRCRTCAGGAAGWCGSRTSRADRREITLPGVLPPPLLLPLLLLLPPPLPLPPRLLPPLHALRALRLLLPLLPPPPGSLQVHPLPRPLLRRPQPGPGPVAGSLARRLPFLLAWCSCFARDRACPPQAAALLVGSLHTAGGGWTWGQAGRARRRQCGPAAAVLRRQCGRQW